MKKWFDNLSKEKERLIAIIFVVLGAIAMLLAINNLLFLILAVPCMILGFALFYYIDKKSKVEKASSKQSEAINSQTPIIKFVYTDEESEPISTEESYIIPKDMEVYDHRSIETRVRGVYYEDIENYEINIDDIVLIKHNPNSEYPEQTDIILQSNGTHLGCLMKDMAIEFQEKFGEKFCFIGKIIDYSEEEDKIDKIIIQFDIPKFRKIKSQK